MLLKYFLKDFEMVPIGPTVTGVTFVFTFHVYDDDDDDDGDYYYYYYYYYS
jgi:hypothetical protein